MPYPAQINREAIIQTAWEMIEQDGAEQLSLAKLAAALGVKAPSLYRHVGNKTGLLRAVNLHTNTALAAAILNAADSAGDAPRARLRALALAYRAFAHAHPQTYQLAYATPDPALRPDEDALLQLALPLQAAVAELAGQAESLAALRGFWALVHGYALLELNGQMQRGGDLEATFLRGVEAYLDGWAAR